MTTYFIGAFLFFMGIFSSLYALTVNPDEVLWACYFGLLYMGSGILAKNSSLVIAQLNILAIPALLWNIDFWYAVFTGSKLWGVTDYFFAENFSYIAKFISLQHVYGVPLALYALKSLGAIKNDAWKWSFLQMLGLYGLSRVLTDPTRNINCVFHNCLPVNFGFIPYPLVWFVAVFVQIYITNAVIYLIYRRKTA